MTDAVLNLFRIPELRRKILITMGLLLVYRTGFHVPVPGVDLEQLRETLRTQLGEGIAGILTFASALTGGAIGQAMIFSLGVMPYISASIIFSLLVKVVPSLERLSKEGMAGHRKINQYTRYATVPICIIQSVIVIRGVFFTLGEHFLSDAILSGGFLVQFFWQLLVILSFTAGTIFIMWLGEQITEHGVGHGISLIIMAGIVARTPGAMWQFLTEETLDKNERITNGLTLTALFVAVVFVVVYITKGQRRIPIQQAKLTRGRRVLAGQRHYLPLKVNQAGVMPIIFAAALMVVPSMIGQIPGLGFVTTMFEYNSFWYVLSYCLMIFAFSYFWTALMFQPTEMANQLKEMGSFIPGIRPGKRTAEYLEGVMVHVTLVGATFLAIIAVLPQIITGNLGLGGVPPALVFFLGGTSILITVQVALDLVDRLNSHLLMRNYDGFMKGAGGRRPSRRK